MIRLEKDLYEPVKRLFEREGYTVKGEVKGCDLTAVKDEEIIVCELKLHFNLKLVYQLLDRKTISSLVYAAVLTPKTYSNAKDIIRLLRALDFGLIFVSEETGFPQVVLNPSAVGKRSNRRTEALKKEFDARSFENTGGVNKTKLMTAYKEQSIRLLVYLEALGEAKPKELRKLGFPDNVTTMLYNNFYGWFERPQKGVYTLSDLGKKAVNYKEYKEQADYFRREMEEKNVQTIKE